MHRAPPRGAHAAGILSNTSRSRQAFFGHGGEISTSDGAPASVTGAWCHGAAGIALALSPLLAAVLGRGSGGGLALGDLALGAAGALLSAALLAAVLLFFSTFLRGYGDILAYLLLSLLLGAPDVLAGALRKPWLSRLGAVVRENLLPHVAWDDVLRGKGVLAAATGQYALALTAYLALAAWIFSRREFSYGQD